MTWSLLKTVLRRRRGEEGVVAILTMLFLLTVGAVTLLALWGLAYSSGAYTTLYGATQASAYAAASEVELGASAGQPPFACGATFDSTTPSSSTSCTQGAAAEAARQMLASALDGQYGMTYRADGSGNVRLLAANGQSINGVLAYEIPLPPGAAAAADPDCSGSDIADPLSLQRVRTCWTNPRSDFGIADRNYTSGIVVIAEVEVPFVPGCNSDIFCPVKTLRVAVAARSGQQLALPDTNQP